jgi:hypothetical protein
MLCVPVNTSSSNLRWRARLAVVLPALLALVLMLPRIVRADFGLLDDPASLAVAERVSQGTWGLGDDVTFGRFRPLYWFLFSSIDSVAGKAPAAHFLVNALLFATLAGLLPFLVQRLTGSSRAAFATGIAFVLGGPVVESVYTLSKPELLQSLLLVACVTVAVLFPTRIRWAGWVCLGLCVLLGLLACLTKETGALLLPISILLFIRTRVWRPQQGSDPELGATASKRLVVSAAVALALALLAAGVAAPDLFRPAGPSTGFDIQPEVLLANFRAWGDWLARDYLYIVPLGLAWLLGAVWSRRAKGFCILVDCAIWSGVWLLAYLPYRFTPEYYLLPLSLGVSIAVGVLVRDTHEALVGAGTIRKVVSVGLLVIGAVLFLLTLPTNASNAGVQLSVDDANADMIDMVSQKLPHGAMVLVNIQEMNEYVWQMGPMLSMVGDRPDLLVVQYTSPLSGDLRTRSDLFVVSPIIENQPYPTVRLGVHEHNARAWEASLNADLGAQLMLLGEVRSSTPLLMVDSLRLFCVALPHVRYCQVPNAPFDTRRFAAGWRLYAVTPAQG